MKIDFNDLRLFERVAAHGGFSEAAAALGIPKSSVSRAVIRLEETLAIRLFQRTTRDVSLTDAGRALYERCGALLAGLEQAVQSTAGMADTPQGRLTISAGIGFGINVLAKQLPGFLLRYPNVNVAIDLTSRNAERIDVAIRMGPLVDSELVTTKLGTLTQYLCVAPSYLDRRGYPQTPDDLVTHQAVDFPAPQGRPRSWHLTRGEEEIRIEPHSRVEVNDALTICGLVMNGVGIGPLSAYLCAQSILEGKLVRVLPDWSLPPLSVSILYPSRRELSPVVRAFVDYMREANAVGVDWLSDPLQRSR